MKRPLLLPPLALCVLLAPALPAQDRAPEEIEFKPKESVGWGLRNVGAGVTALLGGWNYWYGENSIVIETVPADARLDLFYIRANFQKLFMRAEPPVKLFLPSRINSSRRDALTVRVAANGFKSREFTWDVMDAPDEIVLTLQPLPNSLVFVGHTHLANRTTLTLRTTKEPQFRVFRSRGVPGFTLALSETADKLDDAHGLSGGHLGGLEISQVGEDLLLKLDTAEAIEARSRQSYDPIRKEHLFTLDLVERGQRPPTSDQIRSELQRLRVSIDDPCVRGFERAIREGLEPKVIARAHRDSGGLANLYRREAMMRIGRLDRGTVHTLGGESLRTGNPLELELALQQASSVRGYLGLLGAFAGTQSDPETALRSMIAPELSPEEFAPVWESARRARAACNG
jgi:hypothetical protein